ncbi:cyclic nucleotide-binding domain-containing protein [Bdellovibrionota bacterium FG-1]
MKDRDQLGVELKTSRLFAEFSQDEIKQVLAMAHEKPLLENAVLFKEGEPSDALFIVIEGQLEVRNHETVISKVPLYGIVGEMGIFTGRQRSAAVVALEESRVLRIPAQDLLEHIEKDHEIGFKLYRNVTAILAEHLANSNLVVEFLEAINIGN